MTDEELKKHFGITKCTNPERMFKKGKKTIQVQMANDHWSYLNRSGHEERQYFCFTKVTNVNGLSYYRIIFFKLMILIG